MLSFLVLVVISLLPFISTWITSPQEIFLEKAGVKKREEIFKKKTSWRLTRKGWIFLGIAALTIFFAWVQYNENQRSTKELRDQLAERDRINRNELRIRDLQARREQYSRDSLNNEKLIKRDSIANSRVESGKNETILALGKYSLKYDSSQKVIEKLVKDSSKTKVIVPNDPVFQPCLGKAIEFLDSNKNELKFKIKYCSYEAGSSNHDINIYVGYVDSLNGQYQFFYKIKAIPRESLITQEGELDTYFETPKVNTSGLIIVLTKGSYMNVSGTKSIPTNSLYFYDMTSKRSGPLKGDTETTIKNFLKQHD